MIDIKKIEVETEGDTDIKDITGLVSGAVKKSKPKDGIITIFIPGSTASVSTIEYEPNLVKDVKKAVEKIAPSNIEYEHHKTWGDDNGKSHVRATLMGPSLTVPFKNKELLIGTWQNIVLLDFDTRPRKREIILTIIGH